LILHNQNKNKIFDVSTVEVFIFLFWLCNMKLSSNIEFQPNKHICWKKSGWIL